MFFSAPNASAMTRPNRLAMVMPFSMAFWSRPDSKAADSFFEISLDSPAIAVVIRLNAGDAAIDSCTNA